MNLLVRLGQTDGESIKPMQGLTSIVYYKIPKDLGYLAIVRYTAYGYDQMPLRICEDIYFDDPNDFCRLEEDIETAVSSGIDTSIVSHHDHEVFPVISSFLTA